MQTNHRITITYCNQCRWMLRAVWMGQELLTTFEGHISELTLRPGTGGVFQVYADDQLVWCRKRDGGFPAITTLKQKVRDVIAPGLSLGHADITAT